MKNSKIIIFHPSNYFGGASVLFSRIFKQAIQKNLDIIYIDLEDGYTKTREENQENIFTLNDDLNSLISNDDVILCITTQVKLLKKYLSNIHSNPKVILWVVHPYEASIYFYRGFHKALKLPYSYILLKILTIAQYKKTKSLSHFVAKYSGNSIYFMDSSTISATNYFLNTDIKIKDSNIIPIPYIDNTDNTDNADRRKSQSINMAYFGRVESFKSPPLISLLSELCTLKIKNKINFYILGDGKDAKMIVDMFKKKINIIPLGFIENDKAKLFMKENIDILFAMGTAAIDGASIRIPTVLLNASNSVQEQKYDWLHNTNGYSLADYIDAPWFISPNKKLDDIITDWINNRELLSINAFEYVNRNHSISNIVDLISSRNTNSVLKLHEIIKNDYFS
jgi:hypothetical protein